ncbi:MAG: type II toxin-antitoxin system HicA family toxin [Nitrospinota bacterium]
MSKKEKLIERFKECPKDFSWDEMARHLKALGYAEEKPTGKTRGSRRRFAHGSGHSINLHKPHPGNTVKMYAMKDVLTALEEEGLL